ncbi:hypothetical protein IFM89_015549 [Coptis chinensis]|uniref:Uncharacterized protein n=1 Tax=Coptis chinensis TaxID=261450 RepID=A0A835I2F4_9MAGN|nr:hypothetical protein IFM89_015549 [Coptis chinensis]
MIRDCLENRIKCVTLICKYEFVTLRKYFEVILHTWFNEYPFFF